MICSLCGFDYDEKAVTCHASCAFNKYCTVICCPNCGFQTTDESKSRLATGARRLFDRFARSSTGTPPPATCSLSLLRPGQCGKILSVDAQNVARLERLQLFGLTPGATVHLEQRSPEFVLRIDYTSLTVERAIADGILVEVQA